MTGNELINTPHQPERYLGIRYEAAKARAYNNLQPYPMFGFGNWKEEERGILPKCRPFVKHIIGQSASWLFGRPVEFKCKNESILKNVTEVWDANQMGQKMLMASKDAGQTGGVFLKFSYNQADEVPVRIAILDGVDHVRLYFDPHNSEKLIMVRIQYPYWNALEGKWYWFRQEWTDSLEVNYEAKPHPGQNSEKPDYDPYQAVSEVDKSEWVESGRIPNQFKVIPGCLVKNLNEGGNYGRGDLWGFWPIIDQLNFNADLGHKDSQRKVWPKEVYIDAAPAPGDAPGQAEANGVEEVRSLNTDGHQAKVELLEAKSPIREYMADDYDKLLAELYEAVGAVSVKPETITNKGNLTQAVLMQMYAPLIAKTAEKRECWGENGICKFLEIMCAGLSNMKVKGWVKDVDIKPVWPTWFQLIEDDLQAMATRYSTMVEAGFTTPERATRVLAQAEGVEDIEELLKETEAHRAEIKEENSVPVTDGKPNDRESKKGQRGSKEPR